MNHFDLLLLSISINFKMFNCHRLIDIFVEMNELS